MIFRNSFFIFCVNLLGRVLKGRLPLAPEIKNNAGQGLYAHTVICPSCTRLKLMSYVLDTNED